MNQYKIAFKKYLDDEGLPYSEPEWAGEDTICIENCGKEKAKISVFIHFGSDAWGEDYCKFCCYNVAEVPKEKLTEAVFACNQINSSSSRCWFYVETQDEDLPVYAEATTRLSPESCCDECFELAMVLMAIIDTEYPSLMKAIWS